MNLYHDTLETPIGPVFISVDETGALVELYTGRSLTRISAQDGTPDKEKTAAVRQQLEEYFAGARKDFDLTLAPRGTEFQRRVWRALEQIPFGETRSYGELAAQLGVPNASRAVGRANGTNPISIIVPCHRVIGATGALTGYGGGLPIKQWLLQHEGALPASAGPAAPLMREI